MNTISETTITKWNKYMQNKSDLKLSVDCVIFGYDENNLKVLLMESDMPQFKDKLSLVGDLVEEDETLRQAAAKVLYRSTNLQDVYLEQVEAFSSLDRHPLGRVITIAYYSLIKIADYKIIDSKGRKLRWVPMNSIVDMAFDHKLILQKCYETLKKRVRECPIGFNLLPKKFSLKQLQKLYETVLQIDMDKRNFRRKLKSLDVLIDLNENQDAVSHRPAKLYSFNHERYDQLINKDGFRFEI